MDRAVSVRTLPQAVADHLRRLIHRGEVGPGERLPAERDLADQLGVARVSLREALKQLQGEGYVDVRRGSAGGTYVTELSGPVEAWRTRMRDQVGEIDDIMDHRVALETETAMLAAERRTPGDLDVLARAIDALHHVDGRSAFRLADSTFHGGLARAARSVRLENAVHAARGELFAPRDLLAFDEPVAETVHDHRSVYEAVRDQDAPTAAATMRAHLQRARVQLRDIVFGAERASA